MVSHRLHLWSRPQREESQEAPAFQWPQKAPMWFPAGFLASLLDLSWFPHLEDRLLMFLCFFSSWSLAEMGDDDGDLDENLNVDRDGVLFHFCFLLWD